MPIMYWKTKAKVFLALSAMPFGGTAHYLLQKHVTRTWPRSEHALDELWTAAKWVVDNYKKNGKTDLAKAHFIEIGAGRDMAIAIALRMMGAGHITCLDVDRLAKLDLLNHTASYMARRAGVTPTVFRKWKDLEAFGIKYMAPAKIDTAKIPNESIDCFYSIDTLEHIPPQSLQKIMSAAARILKPDSVSLHIVDYSDHFAGSDAALSRFNFLKYSETEWAPYNSAFHYVNRLRHSQYLDLIKSCGLNVVHAEADVIPAQDDIVNNLADQFKRFTHEDLFAMRGRLTVARRA